MAEARAAVHSIRVGTLQLDAISTKAKIRGPQVHGMDGGLVVVIPAPQHVFRQVMKKGYHLYNYFQRACWPAPVWAVIMTIAVFAAIVINSPPESWWRSGPVADFLWTLDNKFLGLVGIGDYFPGWFRVMYLAFYISMAILMTVAVLQRLFIRILLNYRAWMYEKKPSMITMAWGAMLKGFFMGQREPLLYSFQSAMPKLPVPPLKDTMQRYLASVKPLLSDEDYEVSKKAWEGFIKGEGLKFQKLLQLKSWVAGNYVSDWWEKYVYLRSRSPILINSNYYGLGYANHIPTDKQTARAASLGLTSPPVDTNMPSHCVLTVCSLPPVHNYMLFKKDLETEKLKPTTIRG